ncbi:MAG: carboxypeptidase-like regulatory domain-containing protein [Candidatus Bathyarchaeota archaeon]|nr:carboxypeptidase-like regulatory domain-containing protein [Candidatus Bathyarchaeota archaeon]
MAVVVIRVVDKATRKPVPFAPVQLGAYKSFTDHNGVVTFDVAAGVHTISVRHSDFRPISTSITIPPFESVIYLERARFG